MSDQPCSGCGASFPIKSLYDLNDKPYCTQCLRPAIDAAKNSGQPATPIALINKSICARCNSYLAEGVPFVQMRQLRFCQACAALIKDWKYPQWLRLSFAGLLVLLVAALTHGAKYFSAGKSLYIGEHLVEERKYAEALPYLERTLKIAPASDKGVLLAAKAALLSGHPEIADQALHGHNDGYFEDANSPQFQEVNALWNRALKAAKELQQARKLSEQDGRAAEAAQLVHTAAADYPQFPQIDLMVDIYDGGAAFEKRDYETFLSLSERDWAKYPSSTTASGLASALDCKYAITGDPQYRQRSEELMSKAREMAQGDKEILANLDEYTERHKYRLETRQIINKNEYDRRFRQNQRPAKPQ